MGTGSTRSGLAWLLGALMAFGGACDRAGSDADVAAVGLADARGGDGQQADVADPAAMTIARLELFQAVAALEVGPDDAVTRRGALVANRPVMLRVHVAVEDGWRPSAVRFRLVAQADAGLEPLEQTVTVDGASSWEVLASTPRFDLPAEWVQPGVQVAVEASRPGVNAGEASVLSRRPTEGWLALDPRPGADVRIALAPYAVVVDGADFDSDVSESTRAALAEVLTALWPVTGVTWAVLEPQPLGDFDPGGDGWQRLLDETCGLRDAYDLPDDVLVYGLVTPATSREALCRFGCREGLAPPPEAVSQPSGRCAVGLGFPGRPSALTMAHELGHALERAHSPCGNFGAPPDVDPDYPDADGSTGSWGYDATTDALRPPNTPDLMGYCADPWVSPYTWDGLLGALSAL